MSMASNRMLMMVLAAALTAETTGVARASEQSKRLTSRGLVEFHAEHYAEALQLFEQAVGDDATDVYARYYRAVTRGRLNDVDGAMADLRAVLAAKPDLDQAALELGVLLVQADHYREAIPWLQQAQRSSELDAQASLFLGIAQLRLVQTDDARASFERAAGDPKQQLAARYYLGVVEYQAGNWPKAAEEFNAVVAAQADSAMGREAALFLTRIRQGRGGLRPYAVYGSLGFQYDSNVALAPSDNVIKQAAGISSQADGRVTLAAGGTFVPLRNDWAQLAFGYDFYQSFHFDLTKFNLEDHGPSIQFGANAGWAQFGVLARYDYYLSQSPEISFLQEGTALPWLTIPEGERGRTEILVRVRRRDFKQAAFWSRDAFNYAPSFKQYFYLGSIERYVQIGYQFDREDPVVNPRRVQPDDANQFAYDGNEINTSFGWSFPIGMTTQLGYAFRYEHYDPESAINNPTPGGPRRHDDEHHLVFIARYYLNEYFDVVAGYYGSFNNSNQDLFTYDRNIGSVALEVRY
ncbi:MAG TPA: tetratricopeptide repeat protein [Candidatus Kryptonia bacterium]|nr:tetratricopeptide repeat protein [Candidatus Kryptonia bacterium]